MKKISKMVLLLISCLLFLSGCTDTGNKYLDNYNQGLKYLNSGNYEQAIVAFYASIEIDDKQIEPYVSLLKIFVDTEQEEEAERIANAIKEKFDEETIIAYFSENEDTLKYLDVLVGNKYADKIHQDMEWIVQADYNLPVDKEVYYAYPDHDRPIYANEIVVPYINIDSEDAKQANEEIYSVYQNLIETYNDEIRHGEVWFTVVEYDTTIAEDYASTIIKTTSGGTGPELYGYYVYTFDLRSGKLLSYKDALDIINIGNVDLKIIDSITTYLQDRCGGINDFYNECYSKSIDNLYNSLNENSIKVFIDNNGELDVIVGIYDPFFMWIQDMLFHID